jgi:hypothetical protein
MTCSSCGRYRAAIEKSLEVWRYPGQAFEALRVVLLAEVGETHELRCKQCARPPDEMSHTIGGKPSTCGHCLGAFWFGLKEPGTIDNHVPIDLLAPSPVEKTCASCSSGPTYSKYAGACLACADGSGWRPKPPSEADRSEKRMAAPYEDTMTPTRHQAIAAHPETATMPLDMLVQRAVMLLKVNEPKEGYHGCTSGGKDSIVCMELARLAGVRVTWFYYNTTIDPPEIGNSLGRYIISGAYNS